MTNLEKIRKMRGEELAEMLAQFDNICEICDFNSFCSSNSKYFCQKGVRDWLNSEVKE